MRLLGALALGCSLRFSPTFLLVFYVSFSSAGLYCVEVRGIWMIVNAYLLHYAFCTLSTWLLTSLAVQPEWSCRCLCSFGALFLYNLAFVLSLTLFTFAQDFDPLSSLRYLCLQLVKTVFDSTPIQ